MSSPKRRICLAIASLIFLLFWGLALNRAVFLTQQYRGVSVRLQESGVSRESLERAYEESIESTPYSISAWSRSEKRITLVNENIGASVAVSKISVYGSIADVFPMRVLAGALPVSVDENGCVIDDKTALGLFRNIDVIGAPIQCGRKNYLVRAVIVSLEPVILIREAAALYENLELHYEDIESGGAYATDFIYRRGWAQEYVIVENGFFASVMTGIGFLPAWITMIGTSGALLWEVKRYRYIPLQVGLLLALAAMLPPLLKHFLGLTFYWPDRFLPTRWSDFAFWPRLLDELHRYFNSLLFLAPASKDIQWFSAVRGLLLYTGAACVTVVWLLGLLFKEYHYYMDACNPGGSADHGKCVIKKYQKGISLYHGARKKYSECHPRARGKGESSSYR